MNIKLRQIILWLFLFWSSGAFCEHVHGMLIKPEAARWRYAIVPYQMDSALSDTKKTDILAAMALWEAETVVRFVERTPESASEYPDYVVFESHDGRLCSSSVGREGGKQTVRLAARCHMLLIAHELGHLLGLWHEQARLDRDAYIEIAWENIDEGHYHNFKKREGEGLNQGAYDYDSIMHYSAYAFSKNGKPTLIPRVTAVQIGQRTHLSAGDIASVNALYADELK